MAAEFIQHLAVRDLTARQQRHLAVFPPAAQGFGEKFPDGHGCFLHLVIADIQRAVAARFQYPADKVAARKQGAHLQIAVGVDPSGRVPADPAFLPVIRQRTHAPHASFF